MLKTRLCLALNGWCVVQAEPLAPRVALAGLHKVSSVLLGCLR